MVFEEINHHFVKHNIFRFTVGSLMSESKRKTYQTIYNDTITGTIGFLDYSVAKKDRDLVIILLGIEPEYGEENYANQLLEAVSQKARQLKKRRIIYIPKGKDLSHFFEEGFVEYSNYLEKRL
ncbi:GNAT family N-acetyltransferase [Candidatus Woesearchaeota archaeon]|nr:GNAT family N-acetyltransferase [Candidatus Woesearchaeota archaeon]